MADRLTSEQRHRCMSNIRSSNTKPEIYVRQSLWQHGFRYRLNSKNLSGKPDIVLKKYNTVIFVHGCFWHGHSCKYAKIPATNTEFWEQKILSNKKRDENVIKQLEQQGWKVIVIWQCQLKKAQRDITISSLIKEIQENGK
ncbi:MAG: DNA mismatch endonuclease Vsr [Muribaculaceae bacterium]|nr:DNA mismatch endonuclease Vsr [Muribaculaceae bacterium]